MSTELSPLAQVIHDTIEALPHATRLYPDLYAEQVADTLREAGLVAGSGEQPGEHRCYCRHDYHDTDCPEGWPEVDRPAPVVPDSPHRYLAPTLGIDSNGGCRMLTREHGTVRCGLPAAHPAHGVVPDSTGLREQMRTALRPWVSRAFLATATHAVLAVVHQKARRQGVEPGPARE